MIQEALQTVCRATFWRDGAIRRILIGPSKGLRYRLFPTYGVGPVFGRWEPHLQHLMSSILRPGDVAYDVGGDYGIHSLLMARLVGPTGTVCTFEPHPQIFKACEENIQLNGFTNVKLFNVALGSKPGRLHSTPGRYQGAGHTTQNRSDVGAFTADCELMDRLLAAEKIPPPAFVKIDVDGFEAEVVDGARATVARHRPVLAVDLHNPEADRRVGRFLMDQGYVAFRQTTLEPVKDLRQGWPLPDGIHGSILAVPRERVREFPWLPNNS